ncbi:alpha/beta fold hydrolase [Streptomyces sp. NPDC055952]|uniref:alpha/beta fold hydrolase n=1 Tax=Streptomyces sp. NPDC055952 TaxID=3345663 RepID=UPI0035E1B92D
MAPGRSRRPGRGNGTDRYAGDLAEPIEALELRDAVLVGSSPPGRAPHGLVGDYERALDDDPLTFLSG